MTGGRIILLLTLCSARTTFADAASDARAKLLYRAAETSFQRGDYVEAARKFEETFALFPAPTILYNAAQAYRLSSESSHSREEMAKAQSLYLRFVEFSPEEEGSRMAARFAAELSSRAAADAVSEHDQLAVQIATAKMFADELKEREALTAKRLRRVRLVGFAVLGSITFASLAAATGTGIKALEANRAYLDSTHSGPGSYLGEAAADSDRKRYAAVTDGLLAVACVTAAVAIAVGIIYRK